MKNWKQRECRLTSLRRHRRLVRMILCRLCYRRHRCRHVFPLRGMVFISAYSIVGASDVNRV